MAVVKKKIWPEYFELVESGKKNFELRLDDFGQKEEIEEKGLVVIQLG